MNKKPRRTVGAVQSGPNCEPQENSRITCVPQVGFRRNPLEPLVEQQGCQAILPLSSRPRFRRQVTRLTALGPRVVGELLSELGARHQIEDDVLDALERYDRLDEQVLRGLGIDAFPPLPLRSMP